MVPFVLNYILFLLFTSITMAMEVSYPDWFIFPSSYPDYITGFSKGELSSREDASNMYCFYAETIVNGKMYQYNDYDEKISDYYWYLSPKCVQDIEGQLFEVSSFISNVLTDSRVVLYAHSQVQNANEKKEISNDNYHTNILDIQKNRDALVSSSDFKSKPYIVINTKDTPPWVKKDFWKEEGYYYSVGTYTSRGEKNDAWKTAEERAFFNLIITLAVGFSSSSVDKIVEHTDYSITEEYEEILRYKLFHKIVDAQVIARWPDINNNLYCVKVRIHEDNILSPYLESNGKGNK